MGEQRNIRPFVAAWAGLAALVSSTYGAAQEIKPIAYQDTNLAQYGVPNTEGLKPIRTKWLDMTDKVPGDETRYDVYKVGDGLVATSSIDGRIYAISFDTDGKRPLEYAFTDRGGDGVFKPENPQKSFTAPDWVGRD